MWAARAGAASGGMPGRLPPAVPVPHCTAGPADATPLPALLLSASIRLKENTPPALARPPNAEPHSHHRRNALAPAALPAGAREASQAAAAGFGGASRQPRAGRVCGSVRPERAAACHLSRRAGTAQAGREPRGEAGGEAPTEASGRRHAAAPVVPLHIAGPLSLEIGPLSLPLRRPWQSVCG